MPNETALLLTGAKILGSTAPQDVLIDADRIADIVPAGTYDPAVVDAPHIDLDGYLLTPAAAEPHAHLDKAFLAGRVANPVGDLLGAIEGLRKIYSTLTAEDVDARARRALDTAVARGFTAVRTHADVDPVLGITGVRVLLDIARTRLDLDLTVVALISQPITGSEGARRRGLLDAAIEAGVHAVGGAPALDPDPHAAVRELVGRAADAGLPIDLHLDETLDPNSRTIDTFIREVERRGLGGRATASHCVSLGRRELDNVSDTARRLADVGIAVVTLPQTNLGLQARDQQTLAARGIPPLRPLLDAGVTVAGGGDNWRDMFNPLGRIDPLETAALLVAAGHLSPAEAFASVTAGARTAIGISADEVAVGSIAELMAIRAESLEDAIASATEARIVIHRGSVVARTDVHTQRTYSPSSSGEK